MGEMGSRGEMPSRIPRNPEERLAPAAPCCAPGGCCWARSTGDCLGGGSGGGSGGAAAASSRAGAGDAACCSALAPPSPRPAFQALADGGRVARAGPAPVATRAASVAAAALQPRTTSGVMCSRAFSWSRICCCCGGGGGEGACVTSSAGRCCLGGGGSGSCRPCSASGPCGEAGVASAPDRGVLRPPRLRSEPTALRGEMSQWRTRGCPPCPPLCPSVPAPKPSLLPSRLLLPPADICTTAGLVARRPSPPLAA